MGGEVQVLPEFYLCEPWRFRAEKSGSRSCSKSKAMQLYRSHT